MQSPSASGKTTEDVRSPHGPAVYVQLLRPKQWTKNVFVFAALIFSKSLLDLELIYKSFFAFVLFCGISSCVYILNDIVDLDHDIRHPHKRNRPLSGGQLRKRDAVYVLIVLLFACLICSFIFNRIFTAVVLAYFCLNVIYTLKIKQIIFLDIVFIAIGFVLRAVSGAVVLNVRISPWLLVCTLLLALFLGLNKRKNEILILEENAGNHRKNLEMYSVGIIDKMLIVTSVSTILSYVLYSLLGASSRLMLITVPFVLYGIIRYQYLASKKGMGGSPETALIKDVPLISNILLWVAVSIMIEYL